MKKLIVAFGVCILLLNLFAGDRGLEAVLHARGREAALARDIAALRADNAALRARAAALRDDPRAIEIAARETLGLVRPGEIVLVRRPR